VFHSIKEGKLMKLKATLTLIAASLFLAACDQSGSAAKEKAETEKGINITGAVDNTEGLIKGREVRIGGNLTGNAKGKVESIGALTLDGKIIDNRNGIIKGNIKRLNADRLINDNGQLLSNEKIEGIIKETSNIRGEISGAESVKIVGEKLNNLSGLIRSNGKIEVTGNKLNNNSGEIRSNSKIDINVKDTSNVKGMILADGITKEQAKEWQVEEKVKDGEEIDINHINLDEFKKEVEQAEKNLKDSISKQTTISKSLTEAIAKAKKDNVEVTVKGDKIVSLKDSDEAIKKELEKIEKGILEKTDWKRYFFCSKRKSTK